MYILGIDGGGTKTAVAVLDQTGKVIGMATAGPSSIDTVEKSVTRNHIIEAIEKIGKEYLFSSVFAGLGGVSSPTDETDTADLIRTIPYVARDAVIEVKNDVYNAHSGGLLTKPGIAIIVGTGSVAFGIDEKRASWRAGGYSFKEGDAGSAYDLGFKALQALARFLDGRYEKTPFALELFKTLGASDFAGAVKVYETYYSDRTKTASLARLVTKFADEGDPYALSMVEQATDELTLMVQAVFRNLRLHNKELAVIGSLGNAQTVFKTKFYEKVKKYDPAFCIHRNEVAPVYGAALTALKNARIEITDDTIKNLKATVI